MFSPTPCTTMAASSVPKVHSGRHPSFTASIMSRSGPIHDGRNPCGYYMAGYCRYGSRCLNGVHDYAYGMAFREQWLNPLEIPDECMAEIPPISQYAEPCSRIFQNYFGTVRVADGKLQDGKAYLKFGEAILKRAVKDSKLKSSTEKAIASFFEMHPMIASPVQDALDAIVAWVLQLQAQRERIELGLLGEAAAEESDSLALLDFANMISLKRSFVYTPQAEHDDSDEEDDFIVFEEPSENAKRRSMSGEERCKQLGNGVPADQLSSGNPPVFRTDPEYLLVLDLEGKEEIIEFPVLVLRNGREVGRFQRFVRPKYLFGEDFVFPADCPSVPFDDVVREFQAWLMDKFRIDLSEVTDGPAAGTVDTKPRYAFVTCGDWDIKHIYGQMQLLGMPNPPPAFRTFTNIKKVASELYERDMTTGGMKGMMSRLGWLRNVNPPKEKGCGKKGKQQQCAVPHFGFHHSGMHDVENITMILLVYLESLDGKLPITGVCQGNPKGKGKQGKKGS
eukprot:TRINITY_DN101594_c0_g1_i1.p1 TRINITY_DN101594_c0_g1~~TRINITY_DN101594_c0_g1_i1.p1  ORF type:complete len:506 (-),score=70.91 TRINITY_DN101594_c0_g1_i1:462-1979(-)